MYLCSLVFNEDSFKLEMCRSDNSWTRKFVYKQHFNGENWFPFTNELGKRTLQANGATGTGAKQHKLIMNRLKLEINWSFLTIKWVRSSFKKEIEVFVKQLCYMIIPSTAGWFYWFRSLLPSRSGFLSFGITSVVFYPLITTRGWFFLLL